MYESIQFLIITIILDEIVAHPEVVMIGGPPRGELNLQPNLMEAKQNTTEL